MTWGILVVFIVIFGIMSLSGRQQVPWARRMRRARAGVSHAAEWIAPDEVIRSVEADYLRAQTWMRNSSHQDWHDQWTGAPLYLSGTYLKRYQELLRMYQLGRAPRFQGLLKCNHSIEVRHFSDDGERCLVVDHQSGSKIVTVDYQTRKLYSGHAMPDRVTVHEMVFDKQIRRWKIDAFVQEMPPAWKSRTRLRSMKLMTMLPPGIGRDN